MIADDLLVLREWVLGQKDATEGYRYACLDRAVSVIDLALRDSALGDNCGPDFHQRLAIIVFLVVEGGFGIACDLQILKSIQQVE